MKLAKGGLAVALAFQASIAQAGNDYDEPAVVPSYNFSMPIDHFNASDTRTFNNRFWINDTFYKPGGPVVFYDFGEAGVDDGYAGALIGDWEDGLESAAVELAKSRNGVIIGWEHRYYGRSLPFPVNTDYDDYYNRGIPIGGAASYKYLTVAQSLEDVAYFARRFNQTQLGAGNTVLGGANATQYLGPSHTPWIWVGASYAGARGAWMRLHNPDIIYAVWASSAPVQVVPEGSAYANPIFRALPRNCTVDMQQANSVIDKIVMSGDKERMLFLAKQIATAESRDSSDDSTKRRSDNIRYPDVEYFQETLAVMYESILSDAQNWGYTSYLQVLCDMMESYDAPAFLSNSTVYPKESDVFFYNSGDAKPSERGIAASNGERGAEAALAAYLYAMNRYFHSRDDSYSRKRSLKNGLSMSKRSTSDDYLNQGQDNHAWNWQVLSEIGLISSVNASSPYRLGSALADHKYMREYIVRGYFSNFSAADIPAKPNNDYPIGFGGWRMQASNTMFTNGEFDPWRAYSVASEEKELADFPNIGGMTQEVPSCGANGIGINGHFGLVVSTSF
jgi:hypothetical protein